MRLHSLELTAFGSFRDAHRVDFDALAESGLFLIVGATGAGKSTLLDAVTFGLYGDVAGDRGRRGLRSDHAPAGVEPRITLEVTIRGRRLRITRKPEWNRPKLRGEGTVTQNASVLLQEHTPGGDLTTLATRMDEAGHLITGLLGMSREQFCQVALLPQNAFARFLQAGSDERQEVLERLFEAGVYTSAESWLAGHRTELGRHRDQAHQAVIAVAGRIAEVAGVAGVAASEGPDGTDGSGDGGTDPDRWSTWAAELHDRATAGRTQAAAAVTRTAAWLAERQDAVDRARRLAERQRRHADYQRRAADLDQAAAGHTARTTELDAARRAARVVPLLGAVRRHTGAHARAGSALGLALAAAARAGLVPADTTPSDLDTGALTRAERARRDEAGRLDALRGDADRLADLATRTDQLDTEIGKLRAEEAGTVAELAGFPAAERLLAAELLAARTRAAGVSAATDALAAADELCRAVAERDSLTVALGTAEDALRTAVGQAQDRREQWLAVREARLSGMAAELAGLLTGGAACPV
ncbi:MAG TPA: SMC family ATPase, partial [Mycobacteriales bacterium]|nr:SMC family ATPase [Mycobacteriales bacterium]